MCVQSIEPNINDSTQDWYLRSINAIPATSKETIIMVGVWAVGDKYGTIPFYCVFNPKSKKFDKILCNITANIVSQSLDKMEPNKPFWIPHSRFNICKNYLIVTYDQQLIIYNIKDVYNPRVLLQYCVKFSFFLHGSVIVLPNYNHDDKDNNDGNNKNKNIKLLIFGGYGNTFKNSFIEIEINFDNWKMN